MTHIKTVEAFSRLIGFCTGFGDKYDPGNQNLQLEMLTSQLAETQQAIERIKIAKANYDNEVNYRKQVFSGLVRLASSILRTLEACRATPEKLADARQFFHKISGSNHKHRKPIASEEALSPAQRSVLQLAYVSRTDSFAQLVEAVNTESSYKAKEPTLSKAGITSKVTELKKLNERVFEARMNWSYALIKRNQLMYSKESSSLYETGRAVKKYVRAVFGHESAEYSQIRNLPITKPYR